MNKGIFPKRRGALFRRAQKAGMAGQSVSSTDRCSRQMHGSGNKLLKRLAVLGNIQTFDLGLPGHPQGGEDPNQPQQRPGDATRPDQRDRDAVELQQQLRAIGLV